MGWILVIEDEADVSDLILGVARVIGLEGSALADPLALSATLERAHPSVITVDMRFGGSNGIEVLRRLGDHRVRSPIVLVSGVDPRTLASARRLSESYGLRIIGALQKPFRNEDLRQLLATALERVKAFSESDLEAALRNGEFFLEFQPKVAIAARKIIGAEALMRWSHPEKGVVPPNEFIPLLERSPLLKPFTQYVLRSAAAQRRAWATAGYEVSIAENLDAAMLKDDSIPEKFLALVREEHCEPEHLILEVTETGAMDESARSMEILTRFRVAGFGLSMDDFGTGYSSMVQLHRLPFSEIKIDRSFVGEITASREAAAIVRTIISLGHELGMQVCAEGIEDRDTHEHLSKLRCDIAQGYHYGRPAAANRVVLT